MSDHDHVVDPIPGAPADSLVGLGGDGGFVGQVERELCVSTPPPPPPVMSPETHEAVTRSYPPIPVPNIRLPDMPLRARMLRPWMGIAGAAVLIALVGVASGDDEPAQAASASDAGEVEEGEPARAMSFGASATALGGAAVARGRAALAKQEAQEAPVR